MDTRNYLLHFLLFVASAGYPLVALADEFDPFAASEATSDSSSLEFLAEAREVPPGEPFHVLIKITHPPGWHSYFINPGYVGTSLRPNWELPPNFQVERVGWPTPHIGSTAGKKTYGYEPSVSHLFKVTPPADLPPGTPMKIAASPRWQICDESNCRPEPGIGVPETISTVTVNVGSAV
ncbi:MAG TPA: hypothetical protein DIV39_03090, partial [Verrucomicrobiales bacterium]|nr:hypothetical protein [Verrucomicrobiales bacterium]